MDTRERVAIVLAGDETTWKRVNGTLRGILYKQSDAICAIFAKERAALVELQHIDEVLARRPALADCKTRIDKIERAISTAKRADATEAREAALVAAIFDALTCVDCHNCAKHYEQMRSARDAALGPAKGEATVVVDPQPFKYEAHDTPFRVERTPPRDAAKEQTP